MLTQSGKFVGFCSVGVKDYYRFDHMAWMLEKLERFAVAFYRRICALNAVDCKPKMTEAQAS
jgi:hypothetical protein